MTADETMRESGPADPPATPLTKSLNPAHAILAGAILSAIVTLAGVTLNIRSSERLSSERDKRDVVVAEANDLKAKVTDLERKLEDAVAKIPASEPFATDTTVPPTLTTAAPTNQPPQSIVVVVSVPVPAPAASVATPVSSSAATTKIAAAIAPVEPTPSSAPSTTTSTSTTSTTTTSTSVASTTTSSNPSAPTTTAKP